MRRSLKLALVCLLFLPFLPSSAFASDPVYQTGTLVGIERKVKVTPLSYVFEVVVSYYETVTYELQLQVGNQIFFTDYTPDVQPNGPVPSEWKPNQPIQFRTDKHRLFVKLSYDGEIETFIARRENQRRP